MVDYRDFIKHSKPTPRAESQKRYEEGWDRVFSKNAKTWREYRKAEQEIWSAGGYKEIIRNETDT